MNLMLVQRCMRLPMLLVQPPAGQRCACYPCRHRDRTRDIAQPSFIAAQLVTDNSLDISFTTRVGIRARFTQFESP
jgi:hypothetical protein